MPSGPTGRIRVVNLVTDAARVPLNAAVEGVPFGVNLAFGATAPASLPAPNTALYSAILTGPRAVVFRRTADTSVTVLSTSVTIAENRDYTVYAIGGTGGAAATAFVTTDTNTVVASTSTRVRVVHLASTAGNVDIFVTAPNADLAAATPTLSNVPFRGVSGYLTVPAATYQIRVVPAG
ncbi:MAG: DUF4397 domain-containing protein, partial [Gemmatimonadaceae bacterium]|nr:DUF4397 domain-containing protein [Gemmatimonadaceae bacterium]